MTSKHTFTHTMRNTCANFAAVAVLAIAASPMVHADQLSGTVTPTTGPTPRLVELLPGTSIAVASADTGWWWKTSEPLRDIPKVSTAITGFEMMSGLTVENDILPWAGRIGVGLMGNPAKPQEFAICIQIKDEAAFQTTFQKLQTSNLSKAVGTWTKSAYHGVPVELMAAHGTTPAIKVVMINGWLIAGTVNAVPAVIDTWEKRRASIATSPGWSTALDQLPLGGIVWGGFSGEAFAAGQAKSLPTPMPDTYAKYTHTVSVGTLRDLGKGLRIDSVGAPTTSETAYLFAQLQSSAPVVSDSFLKQVPNNASAVLALSNPAHWLALTEKMATDFAGGKDKQQLSQAMAMMGPMTTFMDPLTGDFTLSFTLDSNGPGLVVTGDAITPHAAKRVASGLSGTLGLIGLTVDQQGSSYVIKLPPPPDGSAPPPITPSFGTTGRYFSFATKDDLLSEPMGASSFSLPDYAHGATSVGVGNFDGLQYLAEKMPAPTTANTPSAKDVLAMLQLNGATWSTAVTSQKDGSFTTGTFEIDNWDWRAALANVAEKMGQPDDNAAPPVASVPAPASPTPAPAAQ